MEKKLNDLFQQFFRGRLDRRDFLTRLAVIPGGVAAASAALPLLNSPKARAQMFIRGGTYSMAERDRRWANIRRMMSENGYECLIVPKGMGDGINFLQHAEYVSNAFFMTPGAVVFPLEGEPAVVGAMPSPNPWIQQTTRKWFEGGEQTPIGELIVDFVNEMGLANGNIAVVGTQAAVEGLNEFINEGFVKYATWATVMAGLPEATFTDITPEFAELVMVKGEEEQANIIGAAQVGEGLHAMLLATIEVGLAAREVRVAVAEYLIRNDAASDVQALELAPGPIRDGQVINSEYGIIASGGYAQVTLCVACGSVSDQTEELAEIAHASMDYGAANLRAGARFGDVIAGMEEIVMRDGVWHGFPQIHGLMPMFMAGPVYNAPPPFQPSKTIGADIEVKPGMAFSFEPGARLGIGPGSGHVKVGATSIVTESGLDIHNELGVRMQRIG
ncbi:MAG: M24 family metallopeptidase [Proteobacteria bacterium]|nr:M24 family metallopeptidase [Pseudomonadota bacterium]